jgi:tRNA(fMet)-specific endonuclease VapC
MGECGLSGVLGSFITPGGRREESQPLDGMTRYLLDTDTLIDFSKGREPTRSRILHMIDAGDLLGVCAINVSEFYSGVPEENRLVWDELFGSLTYWDISRQAATAAGRDRFTAARKGHTLATADALVAAVARENKATILTSNVKDYANAGNNVLSLRDEST